MQVEVQRRGSWHACTVLDVLPRDGLCTVVYEDGGRVQPGIDISTRVRKTAKTDEEYLASRVRYAELVPRQQLRGRVVRIAPFGAFIDVGAEWEGLLHVSKIRPGYVKSVRDILKIGQEVDVWVLDERSGSDEGLALTMIEPLGREGNKDVSPLMDVSPNRWLRARVWRTKSWAAWLDVQPPGGGKLVRGMLHSSEISGSYVEDVRSELEVGEWVSVRVMQVEPEAGRISLSMRPLDLLWRRSPPEDLFGFEDVPDSTWLMAVVVDTSSSGILVDVEPPWGGDAVVGLVSASHIREGIVRYPASEVRVGQEVDVRVLGVDEHNGRLMLSMKGKWGGD